VEFLGSFDDVVSIQETDPEHSAECAISSRLGDRRCSSATMPWSLGRRCV
jgi:hypothetical protein